MKPLYHLEYNGILHYQRAFMRKEQYAIGGSFHLADYISLVRMNYLGKDIALLHLVAAFVETAG